MMIEIKIDPDYADEAELLALSEYLKAASDRARVRQETRQHLMNQVGITQYGTVGLGSLTEKKGE